MQATKVALRRSHDRDRPPAERLIKLPDSVSFDDAAAVLFKGITAQYLIKSTSQVQAGTVVLLYGAAGALGQILAPWAKHLGAFVIGVVSRQASVERALAAGCDAALVWGSCNLPAEVARLSRGRKADVVYDGIGRLTFTTSLDCLRPRGLMVSMGASTGAPAAVDLGTLNAKGSLFLTRPGLAAHATNIDEYRQRANDVFDAVAQSVIKPSIWRSFPLADGARAHASLEDGSDYSDRYVDLVAEGYDAALRVGTLSDSRLVAQRLGQHQRILCASPAYLERQGTPEEPAQLAAHNCLESQG
jgi:NADPH:quinone reductase